MTLELWLAYVVAASVLLAVPGPTIMVVISHALAHGRKSGWATVPGVALGDFAAMSLSFVGLGALLSTSAMLFTVLKLLGAAYLVYLGVQMWRTRLAPAHIAPNGNPRSARAMLAHTFAVTALNPKSIVFFVAFLPQFMTPAAPILPQMLVLGATFLVLATVNAAAYALLAGSVR